MNTKETKFYTMMDDAFSTVHMWDENVDNFLKIISGCQTSVDVNNCNSIKEQIKTQIVNSFDSFVDKHHLINMLSGSSLEEFMKEKSSDAMSKIDDAFSTSFYSKKDFEDNYYERVIKNQNNG